MSESLWRRAVCDAEPTPLPARGPTTPGRLDSVDLNPKSAFPSIEGPITRLNRLGIWIRSLSRSDAKTRAEAFAEAQKLGLRGFGGTAYLALESLYPNCAESLRQQLADSMTDRYAKLQYEAYRVGALATKPQGPEAPMAAAHAPSPPVKEPRTTPAGDATRGSGEVKHVAFGMAASSLTTDAQNERPFRTESEMIPRSRPAAQTESVLDPDRAEPPMPPFEDGKHRTKCEWCFGVLDKTAFQEKNGRRVAWSRKGRCRITDAFFFYWTP